MKNDVHELSRTFRGILLALAVPAAGCGAATPLPPGNADAAAPDVTDASQPPADDGRCTPLGNTSTCSESVNYPCGIPELPAGETSVSLSAARCTALCAPAFPMGRDSMFGCNAYRPTPGRDPVVVNCAICAIGRRTQGFDAREGVGGDAVGRFFAAAAQLEAASVMAFRTLADELRAHGAPEDLVARAERSAEEERRHARITRHLALSRGAVPPRVQLSPRPPRGLAEIATENAVEGCVRETFGALVAHVQAATARDPEVRAALATIAEEETQHAALSWDIAAWADSRLCEHEREMVAAARAGALSRLAADLRTPPEPRVEEIAGMPASDVALAMLERLQPILLAA